MTNAWRPPGQAGWYAQQDPAGQTTDPDQQQVASKEWANTHPNLIRRLLARLRRT